MAQHLVETPNIESTFTQRRREIKKIFRRRRGLQARLSRRAGVHPSAIIRLMKGHSKSIRLMRVILRDRFIRRELEKVSNNGPEREADLGNTGTAA